MAALLANPQATLHRHRPGDTVATVRVVAWPGGYQVEVEVTAWLADEDDPDRIEVTRVYEGDGYWRAATAEDVAELGPLVEGTAIDALRAAACGQKGRAA